MRTARLALGLVLAWGAIARGMAETVSYVVRPLPDKGIAEVEITWRTSGRRDMSFAFVTPTSGTVRDVPALLKQMRFEGARSVHRTNRSTWQIRHAPGATLVCRYVVDPGRRNLDWNGHHYPVTNYSFFHALGKTFLMVPQAGGGMPERYDVTFQWKLPKGWKAVCSWGSGPSIGAPMRPDDLRDSVYLAGKLETRVLRRGRREVTVALLDRFHFKAEQFARMAADIIDRQADFMKDPEFPPFLVTAVPVGMPIKPGESRLAGSGLYHSFALWIAPNAELTDGVENLFSHELFHHWNGRLLRSRQPDKLCYWFIEGFTDYYAWRILLESGYWKPDTYAKWLNRQIRAYLRNPAIGVSNQEIARSFWSKRDTVGEVPYQRGLMLAIRWHALAREAGVRDGIDRLFFALLDEARRKPDYQYSNRDIQKLGTRLYGAWFAREFEQFVVNGAPIELPFDALKPRLVGRSTPIYEFEPGIDLARSLDKRKVIGLKTGSAAARAGMRAGEALLGWRVHANPDEKLEFQVRRLGRVVRVSYFPRGKMQTVTQFQRP